MKRVKEGRKEVTYENFAYHPLKKVTAAAHNSQAGSGMKFGKTTMRAAHTTNAQSDAFWTGVNCRRAVAA